MNSIFLWKNTPLLFNIDKKMADDRTPGFRFYPTEEELVGFYLNHKLAKKREADLENIIRVVDIYHYDPWQFPGMVGATRFTDNDELFFFSPRNEKETHGGRPNRITPSGYWKSTGSPGFVFSSKNQIIGVRKTLVFYKGKPPTSRKTKWKMNEYKALANDSLDRSKPGAVSDVRNEFSLCRLYVKPRSLRAFDRRPSPAPSVEEMGSKEKKKPGPCKGSSSNFETNQGIEKEEQVLDDPIDWETIDNLDPSWESWSSI